MMRILFLYMIFGFWFSLKTIAQPCTTLGQTPETAFPVCGTAVFSQSSVNICGNTQVISRCTSSTISYTDKNPYWYKFTCFVSGTLGFNITPNNLGDDYDWQLYDVTNRNVNSVYTDVSMFVACNWSGESGITGASPAGNSLINCEGFGVPLFSSMPYLIQGHNYLLLISHFTDSQSGYSLSFGGGTGSITDPTEPHLASAKAACDGMTISLKLNKKMKCKSLAANGTDFVVSSGVNIIRAFGPTCATGFDTDSVLLTLSAPIAPGNYTLTAVNGTDGNTMLDNCDRTIPVGENIPLIVYPIVPTPMDSLTKPKCAPQTLELVFKKGMKCSSIAANGSDFVITGSYPVNIVAASGNCSNGITNKILIQLSAPLQRAGNFQLKLIRGNDGNTIIDECDQETPAGQILNFVIKDTVNADFSYTLNLGCERDVINFYHNGNNTVNSWWWSFEGQPSSTLQSPVVSYTNFGDKDVTLIVTNGFCSDTSKAIVSLTNYLKAGFERTEFICPGDQAFVKDTSIGQIISWYWDFGNGNISTVQFPAPQTYATSSANYDVSLMLIVTNNLGCKDTMIQIATVVWNCYIAVPSAFTPNGDGLNDYLYPLNAYKAQQLKFSVFNRFGQRIFYTENWRNRWNGYYKYKPADTGTYIWMLDYFDPDKNKKIFLKGSTILIR
jgi:gliding motility-associated-like protein